MPSLPDWLAGLFRDAEPAPPPLDAAQAPHAPSGLAERFPAETYEDARFGTITRNRHTGWFEAPATWAGEPVQLLLETLRREELPAALRVAAALWDDEAEWNRRVQDYVVEQCLDARNATMQRHGFAPVSADAFIRLLRLRTVSGDPDGSAFEFVYGSSGTVLGFGMLRVCGSLAEGLTLAEIL